MIRKSLQRLSEQIVRNSQRRGAMIPREWRRTSRAHAYSSLAAIDSIKETS